VAARPSDLAGEGVHLVRLPARLRRSGRAHLRLLRSGRRSSAADRRQPHPSESQGGRAEQVARARHRSRSDRHRRLRLLLAALLAISGDRLYILAALTGDF